MLLKKHFEEVAKPLGIETAVIQAVAEVESNGNGFLTSGEPVILFEPHVFWRELVKRNIDPEKYPQYADVLYRKWGEKPYGRSTEQHARLQRAAQIHRESALCSASWGRFQIMGNNYRLCGCETIQDFINAMYKDEVEHLRLFINFIKARHLVDFLKHKDWERFAYGYNGVSYKVNKYHLKLNTAYLKYK